MSPRFVRRIAEVVVSLTLAVVVAATPASALRLAPIDTPGTGEESIDEGSLLLTSGLLDIHMADLAEDAQPDSSAEAGSLVMSSGRLPG
jgi:hypothetical protein